MTNFLNLMPKFTKQANGAFETGVVFGSIISMRLVLPCLLYRVWPSNILNMLYLWKNGYYAILKATGFAGVDVKKIFLTISLSIGRNFGAFSGLLLLGFFYSHLALMPFLLDTPFVPTVNTYSLLIIGVHYTWLQSYLLCNHFLAGLVAAKKRQVGRSCRKL